MLSQVLINRIEHSNWAEAQENYYDGIDEYREYLSDQNFNNGDTGVGANGETNAVVGGSGSVSSAYSGGNANFSGTLRTLDWLNKHIAGTDTETGRTWSSFEGALAEQKANVRRAYKQTLNDSLGGSNEYRGVPLGGLVFHRRASLLKRLFGGAPSEQEYAIGLDITVAQGRGRGDINHLRALPEKTVALVVVESEIISENRGDYKPLSWIELSSLDHMRNIPIHVTTFQLTRTRRGRFLIDGEASRVYHRGKCVQQNGASSCD